MSHMPDGRQSVDCLYQVIFGIVIVLGIFLVLMAMASSGG